jgi:hypothetical protein
MQEQLHAPGYKVTRPASISAAAVRVPVVTCISCGRVTCKCVCAVLCCAVLCCAVHVGYGAPDKVAAAVQQWGLNKFEVRATKHLRLRCRHFCFSKTLCSLLRQVGLAQHFNVCS